jgi:hypothetical protein
LVQDFNLHGNILDLSRGRILSGNSSYEPPPRTAATTEIGLAMTFPRIVARAGLAGEVLRICRKMIRSAFGAIVCHCTNYVRL